jgi:hypothetical protein
MKQQTEQSAARPGHSARFRELIVWWADQMGRHHVPLQDETRDINDLLSHDAVHHELIQEIVRGVYCQNRCGHLDAAISVEDTFTALGRVREKLLQSMQSDVDQINFLDNLGWCTRQYFGPGQDEAVASTALPEPVDVVQDLKIGNRATI